MRSKLNEVNLLNAKLLFSNKLFRAFGLNNNQKLKVVETFDRTKNLREVKLVYATLAESFKRPSTKRVSQLKKVQVQNQFVLQKAKKGSIVRRSRVKSKIQEISKHTLGD